MIRSPLTPKFMVRRFPLYNAVNLDKETLRCLKGYQVNSQSTIRALMSRNVPDNDASVFLALSGDLSDQVCNTIATQVARWSKDEGESCGTGPQVQIEEPSVSSKTEDETSDSHVSNSSSSLLGDLSDTQALETGAFDLPDEVFNFHVRLYVRRCEGKYVCAPAQVNTHMYTLE